MAQKAVLSKLAIYLVGTQGTFGKHLKNERVICIINVVVNRGVTRDVKKNIEKEGIYHGSRRSTATS